MIYITVLLGGLLTRFSTRFSASMARLLVTVLTTLIAIAAGVYQLLLTPFLENVGYGRVAQSIRNGNCTLLAELKACESASTGLLSTVIMITSNSVLLIS